MKAQARVSQAGTLESACRSFPAIRDVWDRNLRPSRFVAVFHRGGVTALYNSLNGKILYFSGSVSSAVQPLWEKGTMTSPSDFAGVMRFSPNENETVALAMNDLVENDFLLPADEDQSDVIQRLRACFEKPKRFENLTIYLTAGCNLHCDYCQIHTRPEAAKKNSLSVESFMEALGVFLSPGQSTQGGRRKVQFFGGEPLVEWTSLMNMVEYVRFCEQTEKFGKEKLDLIVNTNGVLLNDERLEFLRRNNVHLSISLDGGREEHDLYRKDWAGQGTYNKVVRNIQRAGEMGFEVTVLSVLGAHNLSTLPEFVREIRDTCGVSSFGLNPIFGDKKWQEKFSVSEMREKLVSVIDELLEIEGVTVEPFSDHWADFEKGEPMLASQECILGTRLVLFPGGHVAPCVDYVFRSDTPALSTFEPLHSSPVWKEVGNKWSLFDPCCYESCPLIGFCDGGCPVNAQHSGGAGERPICNLSWSLLEALVWRKRRLSSPAQASSS